MSEENARIDKEFNFQMDGDQWCCTRLDFVNLHESPAGFGDTQELAYQDLLRQEKL